ncbi:DUF6879 family protein [Pseudofrankia inefficax]|uniref:DUF6879 domain-containing protein n=1 Tax=Pseudofrankia inefficax (strain DSM 45817 / CECT 9037 / DDB 130130 / EuI1c) TaxID=298654 RepID=E3JC32_PSEI1|nr:DUF6879 family protein [Pseudofrankia inefficax]ADP83488.1 hypothetical protein FraEuI1c_5502 [Pseudofrankia inefficax]
MRDEIRPPEWALREARRLSLAEFGAEFGKWWGTVERELVKSECWQAYQEPETRSWLAYQRGDHSAVPGLLEAEAAGDQSIYDAAVRNGTPFVRMRLVRFPLTEYLTFEMWNYVVRARRGETIEIAVVPDDDPRPLPNHSYFDFLLFDDRAALVHDYGRDGLQVGGWVTTLPSTLRRLAETAAKARRTAVPLDMFLATAGQLLPPGAPGLDDLVAGGRGARG